MSSAASKAVRWRSAPNAWPICHLVARVLQRFAEEALSRLSGIWLGASLRAQRWHRRCNPRLLEGLDGMHPRRPLHNQGGT